MGCLPLTYGTTKAVTVEWDKRWTPPPAELGRPEELLPGQPRATAQIAPEALLQILDKVLKLLRDRCYFPHGCKFPFLSRTGFLSKPTYTLLPFTQLKLRHSQLRHGFDQPNDFEGELRHK